MRVFPILTAAAIGLAASTSLANAQATDFAPVYGTARAYYGNGSDVPGRGWRDGRAMNSRAMARSHRTRWHARAYVPRIGRPASVYSRPMYHAGDPQYWR